MISAESKAVDRQRELATPVILRVHGVGGTTPEILLSHPHPVQVAGDDTAGFYRTPESNTLEAYSWGGITSRAGTRALWLLLLPFALANSAGFMVASRGPLMRALLRLLSLAVTAMAALWAVGIGVDLLAFQCGAQVSCVDRHWWLAFFKNDFFARQPARRMVIGLALPVLLIAIWRITSRFTRTRYEEAFTDEPVESSERFSGDIAAEARLSHQQFWHSPGFTAQLASAHFAVAIAMVLVSFNVGIMRLREAAGLQVALERTVFWTGGALALAAALVTVAAGRGAGRFLARAGWGLLTLVALVNLLRSMSNGVEQAALPGYGRPALVVGLLSLWLALALMVALLANREGFLPVATTALAMWSMVSLQAGSHVRIADWLGERLPSPTSPVIAYSFAYDWFALGSLGLLFAGLVTMAVAYLGLRYRTSRPEAVDAVARLYPDLKPDLEGLSWVRRVVRARAFAALTDQVGAAALAMLGFVLLGGVLFYGLRALATGSPLASIGPMPGTWKSLVPAASWVGSLLPLAALVLMYRSFRDPGTRRRVGVLWDILTFWPRWFHPLAPPPYSARAIPELGIRLQRLTGEGATVVLSAHSQGSVLAAASIARIPAAIRARIALLTHGSPLRRLYGRFFPAYFGPNQLQDIAQRIDGRWINLYRATDPLGGPIGVGDLEVLDPSSATKLPGDPLPPIGGHTFYRGPKVEDALRELSARIPPQ